MRVLKEILKKGGVLESLEKLKSEGRIKDTSELLLLVILIL